MRKFRLVNLAFIISVLSATVIGIPSAESAELATFQTLYSENLTGSFTLTGNSNQTCSTNLGPNSDSCYLARNFTGVANELNNDAHVMRNTEVSVAAVDSSKIFNSSINEIKIPASSQIKKAYLFWFGTLETPSAQEFGVAPLVASKANEVILAGPGEDCTPLTSCTVTGTQYTESLGAGESGFYVSHADVTTRIKQNYPELWSSSSGHRNAQFTVANVQGAQGLGTSAGWAIVLIYESAAEQLQHIEFKSGLTLVAPRSAHNFEITGFDSPISGDIESLVGLVGIDGDAGTVGDSLTLRGTNPTLLANSINEANNIMNSSVSIDGLRSSYLSGQSVGKSKNTFGVDVDRFTVTNAISHGAQSVRLTLNSAAESFYLPAIIWASPLGKSELQLKKYVSAITQGGAGSNLTVTQGDVIEYKIEIANIGTSSASKIDLSDLFPANLINISTPTSGCTVSLNLLSCPDLGSLSPGQSAITITALAEVSSGSGTFSNFASATYSGHQGLTTTISNIVTVEYAVRSVDLSLTLKFADQIVQAGSDIDLLVNVNNLGPISDDSIQIRLTLPTGLTRKSVLPTGCAQSGRVINCESAGLGIKSGSGLEPGSAAALELTLRADAAKSKFRVTGTVMTGLAGGDTDPTNNFAFAEVLVNRPPNAKSIRFEVRQNSNWQTRDLADYISDPDQDSLQIEMEKLPSDVGRLLLLGTNLKFKPYRNWTGTTTVNYKIFDGKGRFAKARIVIIVLPVDSTRPKCHSFIAMGC